MVVAVAGHAGLTIRGRILLNIEEEFRGVQQSAGYNHSVKLVERFKIGEPKTTDMPCVGIYAYGDTKAPEGRSLPYEWRYMVCAVEMYVPRPTQMKSGQVDDIIDRVWNDIYSAMCGDVHHGGLAIDTEFETVGALLGENYVGAQATFLVKYRFLYQNPTQPLLPGV